MRAYLRQWIAHPGWRGVEGLRARVGALNNREAIAHWLDDAADIGADPL
jgi:hypothetical protein